MITSGETQFDEDIGYRHSRIQGLWTSMAAETEAGT